MATWLDDELPEEWPSSDSARSSIRSTQTRNDTTTRPNLDATVARQPGDVNTPQWKQVLSPRKGEEANLDHLVGLFQEGNDSVNAPTGFDTGSFDTSTNRQDVTDSDLSLSAPEAYRRLKVFGQPDTFTNERLDGLLTSLQERGKESPADTFANKSDVASHFLHVGQDLLKKIRKNSMLELPKAEGEPEDTSLEDLERKLAAQASIIETTASSASNGSTLSSLNIQGTLETPRASVLRHDPSMARSSLPLGIDSTSSPYHTSQYVPLAQSGTSSRMSSSGSSTVYTPDDGTRASAPSSLSSHPTFTGGGKAPQSLQGRPSFLKERVRPQAPAHLSQGFDSPPRTLTRDVQDLSILENSTASIESHNLETRPSISRVVERSLSDGSIPRTLTTSDSEVSRVSASQHAPPRSNSTGELTSSLHSQSKEQTHQISAEEAPMRRLTRLFDVTQEHLYNSSLPDMPFPGSLANASIGRQNTTYSGTLLELAHLLADYRDLDAIKELDFSGKDLECVKGLDELVPNVAKLNLSHNRINVVEGIPRQVLFLDVSSNSLGRLSTFAPSFVTKLDISHNGLTDLLGLSQLRALVHLDASNNKLSSLKGLENLQALEVLIVDNNNLSELNIKHSSLRVLKANDNAICGTRLETPSLEVLELDNNQLVTINAIPTVKRLSARYNWASVNFSGWDSLEELYYDGNDTASNIDKIAPRTLWWQGTEMTGFNAQCLRAAQCAVLGGPGIDIFDFIGRVYPLQQLDLANVGIKSLPAWLPKKFPALACLNLSFNELKDDSLSVISQFQSLRKLSLFRNQFHDAQVLVTKLARLLHLGALDLRDNPVTRGIYPNAKMSFDQAPSAAYDELLASDWDDLNEQWLESCPEHVQVHRRNYAGVLTKLDLWWLDGFELHDTIHADRVWSLGSGTRFAELRPNGQIVADTKPGHGPEAKEIGLPNLDFSAYGLSTPQHQANSSRTADSAPEKPTAENSSSKRFSKTLPAFDTAQRSDRQPLRDLHDDSKNRVRPNLSSMRTPRAKILRPENRDESLPREKLRMVRENSVLVDATAELILYLCRESYRQSNSKSTSKSARSRKRTANPT